MPKFNLTIIAAFFVFSVLGSPSPAQENQTQPEAVGPAGAKETPERLTIGSKAPLLDVEHWLPDSDGKLNPVKEFKEGRVYLLEFWGTWCGACITHMPDMVKLQRAFENKNVTVISVTDDDMPTVQTFLKKECHHDETLTYKQLLSPVSMAVDPDGSVLSDYMKGVERRSYPMVAIVGKSGLIEYIGTANGLESSLESILADTWDRDARQKEALANQTSTKIMYQIHDLKSAGKMDEALAILNAQRVKADQRVRQLSFQIHFAKRSKKDKRASLSTLDSEFDDAVVESYRWLNNRWNFILSNRNDLAHQTFNQVTETFSFSPNYQLNLAWSVYGETTSRDDVNKELIVAAKELAKQLADSKPEDAIYLDVYAHLLFAAGDKEACIKTFELAIERSNESNRQEIKDDLKAIRERMEQ